MKALLSLFRYSRELRRCPKCGFRLFVLTEDGQKCVACGKEYLLKKSALNRLKDRLKDRHLISEA